MKSSRIYILVVLISFFAFQVNGQNLKTTIKIQAMDMAKALINNDFSSFVKYMHPKVIEYAGGKQKMKFAMDSADAMMKQFGIDFKKIVVGHPGEVITYKGQLQCVVPQSTRMETLMGELLVETSLIALSVDKGKNWYFIDTNIYKTDKLKNVLADLSPKLVIPPHKPPTVISPGDKSGERQ